MRKGASADGHANSLTTQRRGSSRSTLPCFLLCQQADLQHLETAFWKPAQPNVGIIHVNQAERSSTSAITHGRLSCWSIINAAR
jgi:hypothetical protein